MVSCYNTQGAFLRRIVAASFLLLSAFGLPTQAQNVLVDANSGSLLSSTSDNYRETFTDCYSMWKHKQLPLVMTTTGYAYTNANLDSFVAGSDTLFQVHSNLLFETTDDEPMLAMCSSFEKGETYPHKVPAYMNIYLPHGYSFTGYRIEVDNYINESNVPTELWNSIGKYVHKSDYVYFGRIPAFKSESDADNNFNDYTQYVTLDNTSANSTTQVLESKASDSEGWGNVLFFRLMIDKSQFTQSNTAAATIRIYCCPVKLKNA